MYYRGQYNIYMTVKIDHPTDAKWAMCDSERVCAGIFFSLRENIITCPGFWKDIYDFCSMKQIIKELFRESYFKHQTRERNTIFTLGEPLVQIY